MNAFAYPPPGAIGKDNKKVASTLHPLLKHFPEKYVDAQPPGRVTRGYLNTSFAE